MKDRIEYLNQIQAIITRMGNNSFTLKALTTTIAAGVLAFAGAAPSPNPTIAIAALFPSFVFWLMDSKYLRIERLFRKLYDDARLGNVEEFSMSVQKYESNVSSTVRIAFSWSTLWYYLAVTILMVGLAFSLWEPSNA